VRAIFRALDLHQGHLGRRDTTLRPRNIKLRGAASSVEQPRSLQVLVEGLRQL
jgi:hypothetical protein